METENPANGPDSSSVLTSEAFYLNCFKILPCSKRYSHEWTTCPFAHPGEKAKRRDPQCYNYDSEMCPAVVKGEVCKLGLACPHSHHVFESFLHPNKFRTMLCKDGDSCHREVCFFAHGAEQLRVPSQETPHMPSLGGPSRPRRSSCSPSYQQPQHHQQQQPQQHSSAAAHAGHGLQSPPAGSPQATWQQQQSPAGGRPVVHFSINSQVMGQRPEAAMGSPLMAYTACESTGSLAPLPAVLPMGSGDWRGLQAAARPPADRPAAAADGSLPEMYSLLNSLVEEVQARRQEAAQSKNAEDAAKEQLRAVMSALSAGGSSAPMAASSSMPQLVQAAPGFYAASMQMQLQAPGLCRDGSAGSSSNWGHMACTSASAGSLSGAGLAVHDPRRQQQQAAFSSASGASSSVSMATSAGMVCPWVVPAPDGGSNHSTADNVLSWLQLSGAEGCDNSGTVLLPAVMCAVPAAAAGGCPQAPPGMLQHASGALAGNAALGAGMLQCSALGLSMPGAGMPAAGMVPVVSASGLGPQGSANSGMLLPSDYLLQLQHQNAAVVGLHGQPAAAGLASNAAVMGVHTGAVPSAFVSHLQLMSSSADAAGHSSGHLLQAALVATEELVSGGSFENLLSPAGEAPGSAGVCGSGTAVTAIADGGTHTLGWL